LEEEEDKVRLFFNPSVLILMSISCLAHVINLATQALISTQSKSPYFDPKMPDAHVPTCRDEVGLVRAIVVKI
jgi:predicted RNA-binding protein with PUA-like domain